MAHIDIEGAAKDLTGFSGKVCDELRTADTSGAKYLLSRSDPTMVAVGFSPRIERRSPASRSDA